MVRFLIVLTALVFGLVGVASAADPRSDAAALDLAKATLTAHGGAKIKDAKTMVLRGSVEVSAPGSTQTLPAAFAIVLSGEKYRFEIQSAFFNFQQTSDGDQTSSSMAGVSLPPINRVGVFVLPRIEEEGYVVAALGEKFKKKKGFRITSPEGYFTDFVVDEKTSLIKEYESSYELNGRLISTGVAISKYREVDGILVNEKFSQRLEFGSMSAYASFSAKDILINSAVDDDVFTIK